MSFDRTASLSALACIVGCLAICPSQLQAQTSYGAVVGTITDRSGAAVPSATVTLTNSGTSDRRTVQTDRFGNYQFVNLVPAIYRLDVEQAGFKRFTREQIQVEVQSTVRIDSALEVGDVNQTVLVTAQSPLLQTESASVGHVVEGRSVTEMPLNARNVMNLIALAPGVVPQGSALGRNSNPFSWANYQISGGLPNQGSALLDGASLNTTYINLTALLPTQDAIQEFQVQTNNVGPEFGSTVNGVVNLASKSGTNQFHGTAYEFLRNWVLNANTFFSNRSGLARPAFTQNQFGGTAGGPIVKSKTFFFASYEAYYLRQATTTTSSVPTLAMRGGDFSNYRSANGTLIPIYDPLTTCGYFGNAACAAGAATLRSPFPGNVIPTSRLDPTALLMERYWALPNTPGTAFTNTNNFTVNASGGNNQNQLNLRGDQNIGDKQHLFARFTRWHWTGLPSDPFNVGAGSNLSVTTTQGLLADTYSFNPSTVLDVRVAYLRNFYYSVPRTLGIDLTSIGWPASLNSQFIQRLTHATAGPGAVE